MQRINHPAFPLLERFSGRCSIEILLYQKSLNTAIQWLTDYNSNQRKLTEI